MSEFLTYEQVREKFGCKSDTPIKNAIKAGKLTRVYLSKSVKSARITADSVAKFLNAVMEEKATLKDFNVGNGQWAAWKEAKAHEDEAKALGTDPQAHMTPAEKDFIANNSVIGRHCLPNLPGHAVQLELEHVAFPRGAQVPAKVREQEINAVIAGPSNCLPALPGVEKMVVHV